MGLLRKKKLIYIVQRKLEFDAAHRVMGHEGKCQYVHGHRFAIYVAFIPKDTLDDVGRVIDYGIIKTVLGAWIDKYWDHNIILNENDINLAKAIGPWCKEATPYILPYNPTSENLGKYLLEVVCPKLFKDYRDQITINKITVWETPNCFAEVCYDG